MFLSSGLFLVELSWK